MGPDLATGSLLKPALEKVGLKDSEIELALLVIEQEFLPNLAIPSTGLPELSPRTKSMLDEMIKSLEAAVAQPVTSDEVLRASELHDELSQ